MRLNYWTKINLKPNRRKFLLAGTLGIGLHAIALLDIGSTTRFHPLQEKHVSLSGPPGQINPDFISIPSSPIVSGDRTNIYLPMTFESNVGQTDSQVRYLFRGRGYTMFLGSNDYVLQLQAANGDSETTTKLPARQAELLSHGTGINFLKFHSSGTYSSQTTLRMTLLGSNPNPKIAGIEPVPFRSHYFHGNDPKRWHVNVPHYSKVRYGSVYPKIDMVFYVHSRELEFDFELAPGADPSVIVLSFQGMQDLGTDAQGDLKLSSKDSDVRIHKPTVFQMINGIRTYVSSKFLIQDKQQVRLNCAPYDTTKSLIIDPTLSYSTYLGGGGTDAFLSGGIAVDSSGNAYVTGVTDSVDFPTANPLQREMSGGTEAFVVKLDSTGTTAIYATYLGGDGDDAAADIAVNTAGNVYIAGSTKSTNFPTASAFQTKSAGGTDVFISKLASNGASLIYSTYLGGSGEDIPGDIAVSTGGNAYVTGFTDSSNFTMENPIQAQFAGSGICPGGVFGDFPCRDAFVTKLDLTGSKLVFSTYLGGSSDDVAIGIAVDNDGNAYISGSTFSSNFPTTTSAFQAKPGGLICAYTNDNRPCHDGFVAKLDTISPKLLYSTYLGGPGDDQGFGIAVDPYGYAYVTGQTNFTSFPTVNALQRDFAGTIDAFVTKINLTGSGLIYSTYLGGSGSELGFAVAVDNSGHCYVTGATTSDNLPTVNSMQPPGGGFFDVFVAKLTPSGSALEYSTYLGGSDTDFPLSIAIDASGNAYITGQTRSRPMDFHPFPITSGVYQTEYGGGLADAFVTKISDRLPEGGTSIFVPIVLSAAGLNNSFFNSEMTLTNRASSDALISFTYTAAFGGGNGGSAYDILRAGQQRVISDAIIYLKSIGISIPDSGNRGGTLMVRSSAPEVAVTVRTTTLASTGRAGLAYIGIPKTAALTAPSYLCGLRQNAVDRTNVAVQNVGTQADGDIVVRLSVFSGDPNMYGTFSLEEKLTAGAFKQYTEILNSPGYYSLPNAYIRVERISGRAPYYVYAVINDQRSSDGSFIPPIPETVLTRPNDLILPVLVETPLFTSELILSNLTPARKKVHFTYVADGIQSSESRVEFVVDMEPSEQLILPNVVQWLREQGVTGVQSKDQTYAGALFAKVEQGDLGGLYLGARTSAEGIGGRYGVFYPSVSAGQTSSTSVWLYDLQQNDETRTNLGLVNTGEADENPDTFRIEFFDGETGLKINTVEGVTLNSRRWTQIGSILTLYAPGITQAYIRVTRTEGSNPFIVYAVINDGGHPGERTGDGAFVPSSP